MPAQMSLKQCKETFINSSEGYAERAVRTKVPNNRARCIVSLSLPFVFDNENIIPASPTHCQG